MGSSAINRKCKLLLTKLKVFWILITLGGPTVQKQHFLDQNKLLNSYCRQLEHLLYLDVDYWVLTAVLGPNASDVFVLMFLEQYSRQIIETEHKNA